MTLQSQRAALSVTLYAKAECHLCEDALAALERLRARYPHQLQQVDISVDADLLRRYGERIPVLEIDGREYAAPLPPALLERVLRQATRGLGAGAGQ